MDKLSHSAHNTALCSAVQLRVKGNENDCLRFIKLKRDSNEQTHGIQSTIISEREHLFQMHFNFLNLCRLTILLQVLYL